MPVHTYTNWNSRPSDEIEQIEPFRKYFFICEGANTETFYFRRLIDLRKQLGIHPLIDIRLWEKTDEDRKSLNYRSLTICKSPRYMVFLSHILGAFLRHGYFSMFFQSGMSEIIAAVVNTDEVFVWEPI